MPKIEKPQSWRQMVVYPFKLLLNRLLTDLTNSRVFRYALIILVLGSAFGLAKLAGIFQLDFVKQLFAYFTGLKVQ